jgi:hypothetical protein
MASRRFRPSYIVAGTIGIILGQPSWATARKFDLACVGLEQGGQMDGVYTISAGKPPPMRLRIDLDRKLWCIAKCGKPGLIRVSPATLQLEGGYATNGAVATIDRQSGIYSHRSAYGSITLIVSYKCLPSRFSGIPSALF